MVEMNEENLMNRWVLKKTLLLQNIFCFATVFADLKFFYLKGRVVAKITVETR